MMDELVLKFKLLESFRKKELLDFLDFLLKKQESEKAFSFLNYKEKIINASIWEKQDIEELESNIKKMNEWPTPEW